MKRIGASLLVSLLVWPSSQVAAQDATLKESRPSVVVATVMRRDVSRQKRYVGRVQAVHTVKLVARVSGFLEKRNFKEGSFVKKGELLFVIEQAPYLAAVNQSAADLAASEAQLKNDEVEFTRNKNLYATKDVTKETLDASRASLGVAKANVKKAEAGLAISKLNLSYTEIRAPIDGRISAANINVGNLVDASSGPLATVVSLNPIYVTWYVSETDLIEARKAGIVKGADASLTPHLKLADGSAYPYPGKLDYLDIEVGQATDTIKVRARFPNAGHILIPGQFVYVTVAADKRKSAVVVPSVSLQQDQRGHYVLVVDKDGKVARRTVKLGQQVDGDFVVTDGLSVGEKVITEGIQKVVPGNLVNVVERKG